MYRYGDNIKSILIVSYHFAPDASVGTKRILRLVKSLREDGWRVGVLTVKEKYYEIEDHSISADGVTIYRTSMFGSINLLFRGMSRVVRFVRNLLGHGSKGGDHDQDGHDSQWFDPEGRSLAARIRHFFLSLSWCPDNRQGWIPFAFFKCLALSRKYDIIYTSAPPHTANLIMLLVSFFKRRVKWVAEFRDPWTQKNKEYFFTSSISNWLEARWEALVLRRALKLVVVSDAMKEDFARRYPMYEKKVEVFYNGYDESDYRGLMCDLTRDENRKTVILHAGTLYHGRDPGLILRPVAELINEGKIQESMVEVRFLGDSAYEEKPIEEMAAEMQIKSCVKVMGQVSYAVCLEEINDADVLLLFNIDQPLQVPAKLFEYLACRKRILAVSNGGNTDEIIGRTNVGTCVHPDDHEGLKGVLQAVIKDPFIQMNEDEINKYRSVKIFYALSNEIEGLVSD